MQRMRVEQQCATLTFSGIDMIIRVSVTCRLGTVCALVQAV